MKAYGGVNVRLYMLLNAALDAGEWSDFRPGDFYPPQLLELGVDEVTVDTLQTKILDFRCRTAG
jgi:hypothetical protein